MLSTNSLTDGISDPAVRKAIDTIVYGVLLPYQREDVLSNDRFRWNNWSRQTGKSFGKTLRRILRGIARKRDQFFLSAGAFQSRDLIRKTQVHLDALKIGFQASERALADFEGERLTQFEIELPKFGIRIIGRPANPLTARGLTGDVFLDEFAMHRYDRDIWGAMYPTVTRGAGEIDIASTPKGKQNKFYELRENAAYGCQTVTIDQAIADGLEVDRQQLYEAMGDEMLFRQEFLCEFVDEATAFLTLEVIRACEDEKLPRELDIEALEQHTGDVVVGVDVGRTRDLTVIWAFDAIGGQLLSRGLIELASTSFRDQSETLCRVLDCKCVRKCGIDSSGLGMQLAEQLAERYGLYKVEGHTFTAQLKEEMAGKLRVKMEGGSVRIPADKKIRDDLHSIEKSVTLDGHIRLRATRQAGSHADRFWAGALAVYSAADEVVPVAGILGPRLHSAGMKNW